MSRDFEVVAELVREANLEIACAIKNPSDRYMEARAHEAEYLMRRMAELFGYTIERRNAADGSFAEYALKM